MSPTSSPPIPTGRILVVVALGLATVLAFHFSSSVNTPTQSGVIMNLPTYVGDFIGRDEVPSEGEKYVLPKDTEIVKKSYTTSTGDMLSANVVLAGAEKRSIHRPELCLPAQGWSINGEHEVPVRLVDGRTISVMQVSISRPIQNSAGDTRTLNSYYYYWFVGNGITTASHVTRLLINSWDRVLHHKNHRWAYVAVSGPILEGFKRDGKDAEETQSMIADFIAEMAPQVMRKAGEKADTVRN